MTASGVTSADAVEASTRENTEDAAVRLAVAQLSAHPRFAALFVTDRLLVRWVMAIDAVAGGYSPRDQVEFLRPQGSFLVRESEGRLLASAGGHQRYALAAEMIGSIDVAGAVEIYRRYQTRLEEIYDEVGWAGEDFDTRMREAIDHLLEVEGVAGPFDLEQRTTVYAYADDRVEQLSDAQKQLLRMGPDNSRRVLATLHELRDALGWPPRAPESGGFEVQVAETGPDERILTADAPQAVVVEVMDDRVAVTQKP